MSTLPTIDDATIERAVDVLRSGGLVAYPTDTVYGLAARPSDDDAVRRLFEAKGRSLERAVPLLIASPRDLSHIAADVPDVALRLMRDFWPGALTLVLRTSPAFKSLAAGETVALRVPDHPVPRDIVRTLGEPITGTSANLSGGPEPLTPDGVREQLDARVDFIVEGGQCPGGRPSAVIDCTTEPPRLLREGAISREELVRSAATKID